MKWIFIKGQSHGSLIVINDQSTMAHVIDPGMNAQSILSFFKTVAIKTIRILFTQNTLDCMATTCTLVEKLNAKVMATKEQLLCAQQLKSWAKRENLCNVYAFTISKILSDNPDCIDLEADFRPLIKHKSIMYVFENIGVLSDEARLSAFTGEVLNAHGIEWLIYSKYKGMKKLQKDANILDVLDFTG